jgi:hypothetical protein
VSFFLSFILSFFFSFFLISTSLYLFIVGVDGYSCT